MPRVRRASLASASGPYTAATPGRWARARIQNQSAGRSWCIARPRPRGAVLPGPPPPPQSVTAGQNSPGVVQHAPHVQGYTPVRVRRLSRPRRVPGPLASPYLLWAEGLRRWDDQRSLSTISYRRIALGSKPVVRHRACSRLGSCSCWSKPEPKTERPTAVMRISEACPAWGSSRYKNHGHTRHGQQQQCWVWANKGSGGRLEGGRLSAVLSALLHTGGWPFSAPPARRLPPAPAQRSGWPPPSP